MTTTLSDELAVDLDAAFVQLVHTYQDGVYSGVRRLTATHADAEDVTQEAFVRAYRALQGYDPDRIRQLQIRPWLWTIALNLCRNAARTRSRRVRTVALVAEHESKETADLESLPMEADVAWQRRLDQLTRAQRTAVVLRHVADLSYAEIADATGRPEGSVKSDVHRGLERLRTIMSTEEDR